MIKDLYGDFIKEHWKYYLFYICVFISIPLRQAALPHLYGKIINNLKGNNIVHAKRFLFYLLIVWVIIQICNMIEKYGEIQLWPKLEAYIEENVYKKIIDRYSTCFEELKIGELLTKIIKLPWIVDYMQDNLKHFLLDNVLVIGTNLAYLFYHNRYLGGVYFVGMLLYILLSWLFDRNCKDYLYFAEIQYDRVHEIIEDSFNNLISIYTNNKQSSEKQNINNENKILIKHQINKEMCNTKYKVFFVILNILIFVGLNYTALYLYTTNKLNIGSLVSIFILNYNILNNLIMYYENARKLVEMKGNFKYVNDFLDSIPKEESSKTLKLLKNNIDIKLVSVCYSHDGNKKVINNLNLHIPYKQSVVIMGGVGCGKSTIAKLCVRLLKHETGQILINSIPIEKYDINSVRNSIVYVPQSPILFDRTLWDNLIYGLPKNKKMEPQEIYDMLERVGLHNIVKLFKEKMFKSVGKKGSALSGGQRQIVWLLRSLIHNYNVFILDEPTSALDENSKDNILELIKYIGKNKTLIVITHDKTIIDNMDRLVVVDKGQVSKDIMLNKDRR